MTSEFTSAEVDYLTEQTLGRLATIRSDDSPQNNPVAFIVDGNTIVIGGYDLQSTQKFRNLYTNAHVSLVVDDIVSVDPWQVRGIEIRGEATPEIDVEPPVKWMSRDLIRIAPARIIAWGIDAPAGANTAATS